MEPRRGRERPTHSGARQLGGGGDGLRFGKVTSAQEQVVDGVNYMLFLDAADTSGDEADYAAVVYEQERTNTRELMSFARAATK